MKKRFSFVPIFLFFLRVSWLVTMLYAENVCSAQEQTLFTGKHQDSWASLSLGYVNKYWQTDFGNQTVKENIWGEEGKKIHGIQVGLHVSPCLPMGLGAHSGLFYELYLSETKAVKDAGYDDFREHNLYMPLHALYRFPLAREASVSLFGGLGFNWAMWGTYNNNYRDKYSYEKKSHIEEWHHYGNGEWPRHLNVQWEVGCCVRIKMVQVRFTYSRGLTDHKLYTGYKTLQNKIGISVELAATKDAE